MKNEMSCIALVPFSEEGRGNEIHTRKRIIKELF